jgi:hypothetical protein
MVVRMKAILTVPAAPGPGSAGTMPSSSMRQAEPLMSRHPSTTSHAVRPASGR